MIILSCSYVTKSVVDKLAVADYLILFGLRIYDIWQFIGRLNHTTTLLVVSLLGQVHVHGKDEIAALVLAFGLNHYVTPTVLDDPLANHQPNSDALLV